MSRFLLEKLGKILSSESMFFLLKVANLEENKMEQKRRRIQILTVSFDLLSICMLLYMYVLSCDSKTMQTSVFAFFFKLILFFKVTNSSENVTKNTLIASSN
jgi:hypothetical protein